MGQKTYDYVIIGGGLAAASAAEGIREIDPKGSVVMICQETRLPYHRPPLSKGLLLGTKDPKDVFCKTEDFYQENKIDMRLGLTAERLDPVQRNVVLSDGGILASKKVLLATGSRARNLELPGVNRSLHP